MTHRNDILFSGPMIRAILDGRKTITRRVIASQVRVPQDAVAQYRGSQFEELAADTEAPYASGQRVWVRENYYADKRESLHVGNPAIIYAATPEVWKDKVTGETKLTRDIPTIGHPSGELISREDCQRNLDGHRFMGLRPSIFMPRWASRLNIDIRYIRPEPLQEITQTEAAMEGVEYGTQENGTTLTPLDSFARTWDLLNKKRGYSWASNPWVWVIGFHPEATCQ